MPTFDGLNRGNYNGLLTSLTKRRTVVPILGNVFFTAAYTWSHNLDNGSGFNSRISSIPYYNHNRFYGTSDFDIRHRLYLQRRLGVAICQNVVKRTATADCGLEPVPIFFVQSESPSTLLRAYASAPPIPALQVRATDSWSEPTRWSAPFQHLIASCANLQRSHWNYWFDPSSFQQDPCTGAGTCPLGFYGTYRRNSFQARGERILTWRSKSQPTLSASRQNSSFERKPQYLQSHRIPAACR